MILLALGLVQNFLRAESDLQNAVRNLLTAAYCIILGKCVRIASHQMFHQQNKEGEKTMKKILIIAIAVLFSLVGLKYANAQTFGYGFGGHLTTFNLDVTY
jgi:hypothetical protein